MDDGIKASIAEDGLGPHESTEIGWRMRRIQSNSNWWLTNLKSMLGYILNTL